VTSEKIKIILMKRYTYFLVFGIIFIASSLTFCEKKAPVAGPPEAKFVVSPGIGMVMVYGILTSQNPVNTPTDIILPVILSPRWK